LRKINWLPRSFPWLLLKILKESKFDMNRRSATFTLFATLVLACSYLVGFASAQDAVHFYAQPPIRIITGPDMNPAGPPPGAETPGSIACVYLLVVKPTKGCPIATSKALPSTKGWGAIALVDAFDNPQAVNDVKVFAQQFGIKKYSFKQVYATGHKPQFNSGWALEEALDIEMAVAMAPKAKIYLVEAATNNNSDLYFAEKVAADLVAKAGGGMISNSWQGSEYSGELQDEKTYFSHPGIVYFASSGDGGYNNTGFPAVAANVVAAGGTQILRNNGKFLVENYWSGGGSGLSQFEPRPTYQNIIKKIVGSQRGVPDFSAVATNVGMYDASNGGWFSVAGTSISSPLLAGIINAAGSKAKSTKAELMQIYKAYANKKAYTEDFRDIINPAPNCKKGWDFCDGVGSPTSYEGK
jgi:kumamolisin